MLTGMMVMLVPLVILLHCILEYPSYPCYCYILGDVVLDLQDG